MAERFLITGANGCIGAWVVRELLSEAAAVVALDLSEGHSRLSLLLARDELEQLTFAAADITDTAATWATVAEHGITHVVHLAALQIPFCRANPPLGAAVNVMGTVNVFEAVRNCPDTARAIVYASSIAAYDALDDDGAATMARHPSTLYGVYKRANEGTAAVYADDFGVGSIGLRPHTLYGLGRDQGLTSAPTRAMLAAAAGKEFHIPFGGTVQLQYVRDVARTFIAAARAVDSAATVHDLPGRRTSVEQIAALIAAAAPTAPAPSFDPTPLPFPSEFDGASLTAVTGPLPETPLEVGIAETVTSFRRLLAEGQLAASDG